MDDDIDSLKEAVQKLDVQQTCSMDTAAENHRGKTHKNSPLHPDWKPIPTPAIIRELEHINDDLVENQRTLTTKDVPVKAKTYANGMTQEESFAAAMGYSLKLIAPHLQEESFAAAMGYSLKEWKESNLS